MYDFFGPRPAPSTRRIIFYLILKKSHHTFITGVTNEDEESCVYPPAEPLERERLLQKHWTETVLKEKYLVVVLRSEELTNCNPVPAPNGA